MEDAGHYRSGPSDPPPTRKARSMNLQKCDFCRDRKVRVSDALVALTATNHLPHTFTTRWCVTERHARSVSPRIGIGPTNAIIAKEEERSAARLALPRGNQEYQMHQIRVTPLLLLAKAALKPLRRSLRGRRRWAAGDPTSHFR